MKIRIIACCKNEEVILPFFLQYYSPIVDEILLYDGNSTDKSLEIISQYPKARIVHTGFDEKMDERQLTSIRNNEYKKDREQWDWQIIIDVDEFIYHKDGLRNKLEQYRQQSITVPKIVGYEMKSLALPKFDANKMIIDQIQTGEKNDTWQSKNAIFNPKIVDINYEFGCHVSHPSGNVVVSEPELMLLHYRWLSYNYFLNKNKMHSDRLSDFNKTHNLAYHFTMYSKMTEEEYVKSVNKTKNIFKGDMMQKLPEVTCVVSTRNRLFSTLPQTILGICFQTYKPKHLLIFDDGDEHEDLRENSLYSHLYSLISFNNITWEWLFSKGSGQVSNHIDSIRRAKTDWIWRLDDDNTPQPDVLEKLVRHIAPDVGAIGGAVVQANNIMDAPTIASNKIEDIYLGSNEQWFIYPKDSKPKEVDHLYSSFIYRKDIAEYCDELSIVGHREETILTYDMKRKGYKNIFDPTATTWHFCNPIGGIRSESKTNNIVNDERIFSRKIAEWNVKVNDFAPIVLENGIGDHYAFKYWLSAYLKKNEGKQCILFVTFPEVFSDVSDVKIASIADAKNWMGNIDKHNVYKWMIDNQWTASLTVAYKKLHKLPNIDREKEIKDGEGDTIIISPYSQHPLHPKSYPYWNELIPLLKTTGYKIVQIGRSSEKKLDVDEHVFDRSFKDLEKLIAGSRYWICVDNFLQHFCNCMNPVIKGMAIFGVSDPIIFGYQYNKNILKSKKYLRSNQFDSWDESRNNDSFLSAEDLFRVIKKSIPTLK